MDPQRETASKREFLDRVHDHQGIVRKICAAYAADRAEREDLAQEIWLQLWRAYPSFRGDASFATWMYRVALNAALLVRRGAGRRPQAAPLEAAPEPASTESGDPLEADEEVRLLYACVRELPSIDRGLVLLHLEGQPHASIAEVTGIGTENVAVRLHRAKKRLLACLRARGVRP